MELLAQKIMISFPGWYPKHDQIAISELLHYGRKSNMHKPKMNQNKWNKKGSKKVKLKWNLGDFFRIKIAKRS